MARMIWLPVVAIGTTLILGPTAAAQRGDRSGLDTEARRNYSIIVIAPIGGPTELYNYVNEGDRDSSDEYLNSFGKWSLEKGKAGGEARFWMSGKGLPDDPDKQGRFKLQYVEAVTLDDDDPSTPATVDGWKYKAVSAAGDEVWFVFGVNPIRHLPAGLTGKRYPIFYSLNNKKYVRWLTYSGTKRL